MKSLAKRIELKAHKGICFDIHWHTGCEIIYIKSGNPKMIINGEIHWLASGNLVLIANMEEHSINAPEYTEVFTINFDFSLLNGLVKKQRLVSPILSMDYSFMSIYENIGEELKKCDKHSESIVRSILVNLIVNIYRNEKICHSYEKKQNKNDNLKKMLVDMDKNYSSYTIEFASEFMGMSLCYFSRYFHGATGWLFSEYLNRLRVSKAIEILHYDADISIKELSSNCGFNNIRNFHRVFKKYTGMQPTHIPADYIFDGSHISCGCNVL